MDIIPNRPGEVIVLVKVIESYFLETDGTSTDRRVYLDLEPRFARSGYKLAGIQALTKQQNRTSSAFRWNAEITYSTNGLEWFPTTPTDLFAYVTADGEEIQTEFTDTTKFRAPHIRIALACSNSSGTSRESATVGLWLLFRFQT